MLLACMLSRGETACRDVSPVSPVSPIYAAIEASRKMLRNQMFKSLRAQTVV